MGAEVIEAAPFPSTRWSMVAGAGRDGEERREALDGLLRRYLPALRTHLMLRRGMTADEAEELAQRFAADKLVGDGLLQRFDREKGSFRGFLLAALHNYRIDDGRRKAHGQPLNIDAQPEVAADSPEPCEQVTLVWARNVVEQARQAMQDCCGGRRADLWLVFAERVLRPAYEGTTAPSFEELAGVLKLGSAKVASNLLVTAKRLFKRALRSVVAQYVRNEGEIDAEIEDLMQILARH